MYVIGTAGHVDHGKSTLVRALTGIEPDRLRVEREREMSIELGFAWVTLPSGRDISVVDVPGHEDFIKNMLAGVGGIDVALLVVAADESVMPQTQEHLAILDLLQLDQGVVALTKIDAVDDPEWVELVAEEVREALAPTSLAGSPIVPVSAVTGEGLDALAAALDAALDRARPREDLGRPRLPIDRVFTMTGFGTVVTGTLMGGSLTLGQEVEIVPGGATARIRGLQVHKEAAEIAEPGMRVAANLGGVSPSELARGQVIVNPGSLAATTLVDANLRMVAGTGHTLAHDDAVDLYTGATRVAARVRLLSDEALLPGAEGWVQFRLEAPIAVLRGDRYIVRLASPSMTLGGGMIVRPHPGRRHKRFRPEVIAPLQALATGAPREVLTHSFGRARSLALRDLVYASQLPNELAGETLAAMIADGDLELLSGQAPEPAEMARSALRVMRRDMWEAVMARIEAALSEYHAQYPLREGMPRQELRSRLRIEGRAGDTIIDHAVARGAIVATTEAIRRVDHQVQLSEAQQRAVDAALARLRAGGVTPPAAAEIQEALGAELLTLLAQRGEIVKASDIVLFDRATFDGMTARLVEHLRANGQATVAEVRDLLGTSRKYAVAYLEATDRQQITRRHGDMRVLR